MDEKVCQWLQYCKNTVELQSQLNDDGVKLMGVQIPLSIIAMPLRRAYALPGAIFLVSA